MKLSKKLLQAMAISLAVGTTSSCELLKQDVNPKHPSDDSTEKVCNPDNPERPDPITPHNCPACGLG